MRRNKTIIALLFSFVLAQRGYAQDGGLKTSPERSIRRIITELLNLELQISASHLVENEHSLAPRKTAIDDTFERSKHAFQKGEFRIALSLVKSFLYASQTMENQLNLDALYMKAFCEDKLGYDDEALGSYLSFLGIQTTSEIRDRDRLLEAFKRSITLLKEQKTPNKDEFKRILAALDGIKLAESDTYLVQYSAAQAAQVHLDSETALALFEHVKNQNFDEGLAIRAKFHQAQIHASKKEFNLAGKILEEIYRDERPLAQEVVDLSKLSLARIAMKQNNYMKAIRYYSEIGEQSPRFRDASFESIVAHAEVLNFDQALEQAEKFILKYPDDLELHKIYSIIGFLNLRSGKTADAKSQIEKAVSLLSKMRHELENQLFRDDFLDLNSIRELYKKANRYLNIDDETELLLRVDEKISAIQKNIEKNSNNLSSQFFALSSMQLKNFKPEWDLKISELDSLLIKAMAAGDQIGASIQALVISGDDTLGNKKLAQMRAQRHALLDKMATLSRSQKTWVEWTNFSELALNLLGQMRTLNQLNAQNAALVLNSKDSSAPIVIHKKVNATLANVNLLFAELQTYRLKRLGRFSRLQESLHLQRSYTDLLEEEFSFLDERLNTDQRSALRFIKDELAQTKWLWEKTNKELAAASFDLEKKIIAQMHATAKRFSKSIEDEKTARAEFETLRKTFFEHLETNKDQIKANIVSSIDREITRYIKWLADLEWIDAEQTANEQQRAEASYQLQNDIIENSRFFL